MKKGGGGGEEIQTILSCDEQGKIGMRCSNRKVGGEEKKGKAKREDARQYGITACSEMIDMTRDRSLSTDLTTVKWQGQLKKTEKEDSN